MGLRLAVKELHLATYSAAATLDAIARGETTKSILAFIPLMTGGGEEGIIQRWLDIAGAEPNHRRRGGLGSLALAMAELKPWCGEWQMALKEWNMRESTFINGWIDEGRVKSSKQALRTLLTKRFGQVSAPVLDRIDTTTDPDALDRAVGQVLDIARPEDLLL